MGGKTDEFVAANDALSPEMAVRVRLLGLPQVVLDGRPVDISRWPKLLALLAYLLVEGEPHTRSSLALLLWPEHDERRAQQNLRQLLHRLRRLLGERSPLVVDRESIAVDPHAPLWCDALLFERLIGETRQHAHRRLSACPLCLGRLEQAVSLYRGPFLSGLGDVGSAAFEEWLWLRRDRFQQHFSQALHILAEHHLTHHRLERALSYARQLLTLDPWNEAAERLLLRALARSEGRNRALTEYRRFRQRLLDDLGVEPEDATQALVRRIAEGGEEARALQGTLPRPATPFFGREREQMQLAAYLADAERRLITIVGPGGSGKTRLALQVAAEQRPDWRDGVHFIPLAEVESPDHLADVLTAHLLPASLRSGGQMTTSRLVDFLRPRELLLVLDNFEHLLPEGATFIHTLLWQVPHLKIVVTSQVRLGLPEEWAIQLGGLALPSEEEPPEAMQEYGAVRLFLYHAQRVLPGWQPQPEEWPAIARLCRTVAGLPLGIELAASWRRTLSCVEIARAAEEDLDFLRLPQAPHPSRRYSLRLTLERSYALLGEEERRLFRALAVFQGRFDVEAARQVAEAAPEALAVLLDWSLIAEVEEGRWSLHPLLHRFAAELLAAHPEEEAALRERHARYYLALLARLGAMMAGEEVRPALEAMDREMDNIRAAWNWAVASADVEALTMAEVPLFRFYSLRGLFREGETRFRRAAEQLLEAGTLPARDLAVRLLAGCAHFRGRCGRADVAFEVMERAWALGHDLPNPITRAVLWLGRGEGLDRLGRCEEGREALLKALEISRQIGVPFIEAEALRMLGSLAWRESRYETALDRLSAALEVSRRMRDHIGESWTLNVMGLVAENMGQYARAVDYYRYALTVMRTLGDRWGESIVLGNLGYIYTRLGMVEAALTSYLQDLQICREVGDRRGESWTLAHLGYLAVFDGRYEDALQYGRQALTLAKMLDRRRLQALILTWMGHAEAGLEHGAAAEGLYAQALSRFEKLGELQLRTEPLAGLIRVALARGEEERAFALAEEVLAAFEATGLERTNERFAVGLACYRALAAAGDPRAPDLLAQLHQQLMEVAERIDDPELRSSFLTRVPAHRELQALYSSMSSETSSTAARKECPEA